MNSDDPLNFPHKPVEDGFAFDVETDSLADTMGLRSVSYTHLTLPTT